MTIEECTSAPEWFAAHGPGSMPAGGFKIIAANRRRLELDRVEATSATRREAEEFRAMLATLDRARALGIPSDAATAYAKEHPRATQAELEAAADELVFARAAKKIAARVYARGAQR